MELKNSGYNDIYFRIIIALIAAHIIVVFGAKESQFELLVHWFYYKSLLLSFVIAFLLVSEVYWVVVKLDKRYDWIKHTAERIGLQTLLGFLLPCISAFLLAAGYFALFGMNVLKSGYLKFDFPVIVIMIILLNVYYLAFFFYKKWQDSEARLLKQGNGRDKENVKIKEIFMVQKGAKNIPLPIESISYFYHDGDFNFVRTFEREDFMISHPLDEVQKSLPEQHFFRVNRQIIVNLKACEHYEPLEFGKLELIVKPKSKESVVISQKRSKAFKEWIGR